jgi:hypothetical protein
MVGHATACIFRCWALITGTQVQSYLTSHNLCDGRSGTGEGFIVQLSSFFHCRSSFCNSIVVLSPPLKVSWLKSTLSHSWSLFNLELYLWPGTWLISWQIKIQTNIIHSTQHVHIDSIHYWTTYFNVNALFLGPRNVNHKS